MSASVRRLSSGCGRPWGLIKMKGALDWQSTPFVGDKGDYSDNDDGLRQSQSY